MWSQQEIFEALFGEPAAGVDQLRFHLVEPSAILALGHDNESRVAVLVPPGEADEFRGKRASFEPRIPVLIEGSAVPLVGSLLRFSNDDLAPEVQHAIVSALAGLADLAIADPQAGDAAVTASGLAQLIEAGMVLRPTQAVVEGLMGELLTILGADDPDLLASTWHREPQAPFDFSTEGARLEVKTSRVPTREHEFSMSQINDYAVPTHVVSVLLQAVEIGASLQVLMESLAARVTAGNHARIRQITEASLRYPINLIASPEIDVAASLSTLQLWDALAIPRPTMQEGIIWMRWKAVLTGAVPPLERDTALTRALLGA